MRHPWLAVLLYPMLALYNAPREYRSFSFVRFQHRIERATRLMSAERWTDAEAAYGGAIALDPDALWTPFPMQEGVSAYLLRGHARLRQGSSEAALADYDKDCELKRWNGRGCALARDLRWELEGKLPRGSVSEGPRIGRPRASAPAPAGACVPRLLSPAPGATLPNGCARAARPYAWRFTWEPCPGAPRYAVEVRAAKAKFPLANGTVPETSFERASVGGHIADQNLKGWTWKVRAETGGAWGPWSEPAVFEVEPLSADCR